jgi:isocitrate/isopropylmalate dehydrogenase
MLLEHAFGQHREARAVEHAIEATLAGGHRTADLATGEPAIGCSRMAALVAAAVLE